MTKMSVAMCEANGYVLNVRSISCHKHSESVISVNPCHGQCLDCEAVCVCKTIGLHLTICQWPPGLLTVHCCAGETSPSNCSGSELTSM